MQSRLFPHLGPIEPVLTILLVTPLYTSFSLSIDAPVGDDLGYRNHSQPVRISELPQLWSAGHRAVGVHYLADHPGRLETGEARKVHGGLRVTRALQHSAGFRP